MCVVPTLTTTAMAPTSVVLLAVNNSPAVSRGYCEPNFTMRVKDLNTAGKAMYMESAQFELRFQNVGSEINKLYVVETVGAITGEVVSMSGEAAETTEAVETPGGTPNEAAGDKAVVPSGRTVGTPGEAAEAIEAVKTRETFVSVVTGT